MEPKELREAGLKVTLPRLKILQMLEQSATRHLSAEEIYRTLMEQGEDIGLATVYRVLTQFEAAGLVMRHHFEGGHAVFEMQQPAHHDHIVCMRCGRVDEFVDEMIEKRQRQKAEELGFKLTEHSLIMYGQCLRGDDCPHLKAKKSNAGS